MTGNAQEEDLMFFRNCGAHTVLVKPLDCTLLKAAIASVAAAATAKVPLPAPVIRQDVIPIDPAQFLQTEAQSRRDLQSLIRDLYRVQHIVFSVITLVAVVAFFIPFGILSCNLNLQNYPSSTINRTFNDAVYFTSLVVSVTLTVSFAVRVVRGYAAGLDYDGSRIVSLLLVSYAIFDSFMLGHVLQRRNVQLFWSMFNAHNCVAMYCAVTYLSCYGGPIWNRNCATAIIFVSMVIALISRQYSNSMFGTKSTLGTVAFVFLWIAWVFVSYSTYKYCHHLYALRRHLLPREICCLGWALGLVCGMSFVIVLSIVFNGVHVLDLSRIYVTAYSYLMHVLEIMLILLLLKSPLYFHLSRVHILDSKR